MDVGLEVFGWDKMLQDFRELPDRMRKDAVMPALRAAAKTIHAAVRAEAPIDEHFEGKNKKYPPGNLKQNVFVKFIPEQSTKTLLTYKIGIVRNPGKAGPGAYYGTMVLKGHYTRYPKSIIGKETGPTRNRKYLRLAAQELQLVRWVAPRDFIAAGLGWSRDAAKDVFQTTLEQTIPDALQGMRVVRALTGGKV